MKRRKFIQLSSLGSLSTWVIRDEEKAISFDSIDEKKLVFLFQGDSITDGNRGRDADPNHIMGHGYAFAVASRVGADFSESGFTFYNRGISGNKISDLQKRWQTDTLDLKPDVLSILIGINDTHTLVNKPDEATSIEAFEKIYRDLLTESRRLNSQLILVLGLPFAFLGSRTKEKWAFWQEDTLKRQVIIRKLAAEFNAILLDYQSLFDKIIKKPNLEYWIWDGIHPSVFGHEMMARLWIKEVSKQLKFLKKYSNGKI